MDVPLNSAEELHNNPSLVQNHHHDDHLNERLQTMKNNPITLYQILQHMNNDVFWKLLRQEVSIV